MSDNPDRALEELPGRPEAPPENAREQETEEGGGLRSVSKIVALVSASVLVGGGIGMLVGVWLGAINPFALGIVGAVAGIVIPVFFAAAHRGRPGARAGGGGSGG